jgi:uncharacterized protein YjiS (DUF1127 family)
MTMTLLFDDAAPEAAPAPAAQSPVRRVFASVATALAGLQAARARRIALSTLLEMDVHRLDDLGLNAQDVVDALNRR